MSMRRPELLGYHGRPVRDPASGRITWELLCNRCGEVIGLPMRALSDQVWLREVTAEHERKFCVPPAGIQQRLSNEYGDHVWLWVVILGGMPVALLIAWGVIRLTLR